MTRNDIIDLLANENISWIYLNKMKGIKKDSFLATWGIGLNDGHGKITEEVYNSFQEIENINKDKGICFKKIK